jgi:hypothetical protein
MPLASRCIAWWVLVAFTVAVIVYFGANKNPRNALDSLFKKCSENKGEFKNYIFITLLTYKTSSNYLPIFSFYVNQGPAMKTQMYSVYGYKIQKFLILLEGKTNNL